MSESKTTEIAQLAEQVKRLADILERGIQVKNDGLNPIPSSIRIYRDDRSQYFPYTQGNPHD